jgi:hypothetical protein
MMRILLALGLAIAIGCKGVEPLGPFAKMKGTSAPTAKATKEQETPRPPVTVPAVKPSPPMNLIYPDEVSPENPQAAVQRLKNELEADQKSIPAAPVTAEISRYKGGVKQN